MLSVVCCTGEQGVGPPPATVAQALLAPLHGPPKAQKVKKFADPDNKKLADHNNLGAAN
jgi:hypothetical protein